jgi:hypothetical protein
MVHQVSHVVRPDTATMQPPDIARASYHDIKTWRKDGCSGGIFD